MRRVATALREERPAPADGPTTAADGSPWGFHAVDGLPDLEAAAPYGRTPEHPDGRPMPTRWIGVAGFDEGVKAELSRIRRMAWQVEADLEAGSGFEGRPELGVYEIEVCRALAVRRVASCRLQRMLVDDECAAEGALETVRAGLVLEMIVPAVGGSIRRSLSAAMADFEAARHRVRLALVAVAIDDGMTAAEIGEAFCFSRQLASRYVKEARQKWPELNDRGYRRD